MEFRHSGLHAPGFPDGAPSGVVRDSGVSYLARYSRILSRPPSDEVSIIGASDYERCSPQERPMMSCPKVTSSSIRRHAWGFDVCPRCPYSSSIWKHTHSILVRVFNAAQDSCCCLLLSGRYNVGRAIKADAEAMIWKLKYSSLPLIHSVYNFCTTIH